MGNFAENLYLGKRVLPTGVIFKRLCDMAILEKYYNLSCFVYISFSLKNQLWLDNHYTSSLIPLLGQLQVQVSLNVKIFNSQ